MNMHTFTLWGRWEGRQMSGSKDGGEHGGDRGRGEEKRGRGGGRKGHMITAHHLYAAHV